MSRTVVAVVNVMRHTRNKGNEITVAGIALATRRGEEAGRFLEEHSVLSKEVGKRGLVYFGHPSDEGRAIQTEEQFYRGLVSSGFVSVNKTGGVVRQNPRVTEIGKTPEGQRQYVEDVKGLIPSIEKMLRGEDQPHYSEPIASVAKRVSVVADVEKAILKNQVQPATNPVVFLNFVSHSLDPHAGPAELIAEQLTGKKISELGGAFSHSEGIRRVIYSNGDVETTVVRQNAAENKTFISKVRH